jgi:hypothetical protein
VSLLLHSWVTWWTPADQTWRALGKSLNSSEVYTLRENHRLNDGELSVMFEYPRVFTDHTVFSDQFMDVSKSPHLWNDKPIYNLTKLANGFTCRTCGRSLKWVCKSLHVHICSWFMDHYYGTPGIWIPKLLGIAQLGVWLNPHMTSRWPRRIIGSQSHGIFQRAPMVLGWTLKIVDGWRLDTLFPIPFVATPGHFRISCQISSGAKKSNIDMG